LRLCVKKNFFLQETQNIGYAMNLEEILSGKVGLAGIQLLLNGQASRHLLRCEIQSMLGDGYRAGAFHLTRAKFKPGRKLLAYFTFPTVDAAGEVGQPIHLAVVWQKDPGSFSHSDSWNQLQEDVNRAGLSLIQRALWRAIPEQGITLQVWPFDPEFPQLVRLSDSSYVAGMFASLGIAHELKQMPVVTPIRYRPGERHVLRYEIPSAELPPGSGQRLYAKLYEDGQDAARTFDVANRVVDWLDASDRVLQGNRPKVMSQEDGVILYPHAPGIPLSRLLNRSHRWLAIQLRAVGNALAILHNGPESLRTGLKQNTFANEAKVVRRASEHIQILLPETYEKILEILDKLQEQYFHSAQEKPAFTHSDFKADHLLFTPQGLTLIDFDTCTLTDPALDIGKFLADLEWWFTLKGISGVEEAQIEFIKGYSGKGGTDHILDERLARARLYHILILIKIVARRVPIYRKEWGTLTTRMIDRADQLSIL
jgi:hypothetical protein